MSDSPARAGGGRGGVEIGRSRSPPKSPGTDAEKEDTTRRPTFSELLGGAVRDRLMGDLLSPRKDGGEAAAKERRGSRAAFTAAVKAATSSTAENAVDDSEDLPDDDAFEVQRTNNYSRRHQSNAGVDVDPKYARVQEIVPFSFHPNVRPLTVSDLESCVVLEDAAFANPEHRCTREKFEYRLTACPELCLGLFCTIAPDEAEEFEIDTFGPAHPVETCRSNGARSVLLAHIVATRSNGKVVTDAAMDYPRDFRTNKRNTTGLGHQDAGQTICIHSLAVHPKLQGCHLGKLIMKAYLQQLKHASFSERCALICQDYLVNFYEKFGFFHHGPSKAAFGGGGWHDMSLEIISVPPYSGRRR